MIGSPLIGSSGVGDCEWLDLRDPLNEIAMVGITSAQPDPSFIAFLFEPHRMSPQLRMIFGFINNGIGGAILYNLHTHPRNCYHRKSRCEVR